MLSYDPSYFAAEIDEILEAAQDVLGMTAEAIELTPLWQLEAMLSDAMADYE